MYLFQRKEIHKTGDILSVCDNVCFGCDSQVQYTTAMRKPEIQVTEFVSAAEPVMGIFRPNHI